MPPQDPYATVAEALNADPYAGVAQSLIPPPTPGNVPKYPGESARSFQSRQGNQSATAGPSKTMDSGEGPIASGLTSFETQLAQIPGALWNLADSTLGITKAGR